MKYLLPLSLGLILVACGTETEEATPTTEGPGCDVVLTIEGIESHTCTGGEAMSNMACSMSENYLPEGAVATFVDNCPEDYVVSCPDQEMGLTAYYYTPGIDESICEIQEETQDDLEDEINEDTL